MGTAVLVHWVCPGDFAKDIHYNRKRHDNDPVKEVESYHRG